MEQELQKQSPAVPRGLQALHCILARGFLGVTRTGFSLMFLKSEREGFFCKQQRCQPAGSCQ